MPLRADEIQQALAPDSAWLARLRRCWAKLLSSKLGERDTE